MGVVSRLRSLFSKQPEQPTSKQPPCTDAERQHVNEQPCSPSAADEADGHSPTVASPACPPAEVPARSTAPAHEPIPAAPSEPPAAQLAPLAILDEAELLSRYDEAWIGSNRKPPTCYEDSLDHNLEQALLYRRLESQGLSDGLEAYSDEPLIGSPEWRVAFERGDIALPLPPEEPTEDEPEPPQPQDTDDNPEGQSEQSRSVPLFANTSLAFLEPHAPADVKSTIALSRKQGMGTVYGLLKQYRSVVGIGHKQEESLLCYLKACAIPMAAPTERNELAFLRHISSSNELVFDAWGLLRAVRADNADHPSKKPTASFESSRLRDMNQSQDDYLSATAVPSAAISASPSTLLGAATPVSALPLTQGLINQLRSVGIKTVGDVRRTPDAQLLGLRGVGVKKLADLRSLTGNASSPTEDEDADQEHSEMPDCDDPRSTLDDGTLQALDLICARLREYKYPVFEPSFTVIVGPQIGTMLDTQDLSIETVASAVLEHVAEREGLVDACAALLSQRVNSTEVLNSFDHALVVPRGLYWTNAADSLAASHDDLAFDQKSRELRRKLPTLEQWLSGLPNRQQEALRDRLAGSTLQEVGNKLGVTRERVRQICVSALDPIPNVEENKYLVLTERYAMDSDEFGEITGVGSPTTTLAYLRMVGKKGEAPLAACPSDPAVPDELRRRVSDHLDQRKRARLAADYLETPKAYASEGGQTRAGAGGQTS